MNLDNDLYVTPSAETTSIISNGRVIDNTASINAILSNKDRTKYELKVSRIRQCLDSVSNNVVKEFYELEETYTNYFLSAHMLSSAFFISFYSSDIEAFRLPFDIFPIVTDVTYKTAPKGYHLCSAVIHAPKFKRSVVFYQAILRNTTLKDFAT